MFVSVCICTWNRAELLDQTLTAMHALVIPDGVQWELLVVNNNCTDHTDDVLARHADFLPLRRLFEEKQGHSHARNHAVDAARGELILWTDDDVVVASDWLAEYVDASRQWPQASFFGGTVDPWFSIDPPDWIQNNLVLFSGPYALAQHGDSVRRLDHGQMVMGANMAVRRAIYNEEKYDPNLGHRAASLIGGDDFEFCLRVMAKGAFGVWVGTARVRHYIPEERLNKEFIRRWFHAEGLTRARAPMHSLHSVPLLFGVPRWAIRVYVESLPGSWAYTISGGRFGLRSYLKAIRFKSHLAEKRRLFTLDKRRSDRESGERCEPSRNRP